VNTRPGRLHHVELWVPDLARAVAEQSPAMTAPGHDRLLASTDGYELELVADDAEEASS